MNTSSSDQSHQTTIKGNVSTSGGDFTARDSNHHGDNVARDKIVNYGLPQPAPGKGRVTLKIEGDFEQFGDEDKARVQQIIEQVLGIKIAKAIIFEPGSVHATVELTREEAQKLYEIVKSGQLRKYGIIEVVAIKLGEISFGENDLGETAVGGNDPVDNDLSITIPKLIRSPQKNTRDINTTVHHITFLLRNITILLGSHIIIWLLTSLVTIFLPRYLGAVGIGKLQFASSLWMVVGVISSFGTDLLLIKEIARQPNRTPVLLGNAVVLRFGLFILVYVTTIWFLHSFGYSGDTLYVVSLVGIAYLLRQFIAIAQAALQGLEKMKLFSISELSGVALYTLMSITLLVSGWGIYTITLLMIFSSGVNLAILLFFLRRLYPLHLNFTRGDVYYLLQTGWPYLLSNIFFVAYMQVDVLVMSVLTDERSIGWYSAASRLFGILIFIPVIYITAAFPVFSRMSTNNTTTLKHFFARSFDTLFLLGVPLGLGIIALANPFVILIYGSEFANSGPILAVLGIALILAYPNILIGRFLIAIDRQNAWTMVMAIATVVTILINIVLIPYCAVRFGNGALAGALSSVATELGMMIAGLILLPTGALTYKNLWVAIRVLIAGVIMMLVVWRLEHLFLLLPVLLGAITYISLLFLLRVVTKADFLAISAFWIEHLDIGIFEPVANVKK